MTQILNAKGFPINRSLRDPGRCSRNPTSQGAASRNAAAGRSFIEVTLLVSLVALVAAAGVTGLRKDVQKNMCWTGAALNNDQLQLKNTSLQWNANTEVCSTFKTTDSGNITPSGWAFSGKLLNTSYPY